MRQYPKIESVFKRDEKTHKFIEGSFSLPEFEYLKDNLWLWTEKVDGTNVRVIWDGHEVRFGGRTDNAQMPPVLLNKLSSMFPEDKFRVLYPDSPMCLYGEGYGAKIQKGGGNYIPDGADFILFDILIGSWWLKDDALYEIAGKLGLQVVPKVGEGTILEAVSAVKTGVTSTFGNFAAEGLVLKTAVPLLSRNGERIVTKMKHRDF